MNKKPAILKGSIHRDERGNLTFFNAFDMSQVQRFYIVEHPDTAIIRAWQGHRLEQKWFCVEAGAFRMAVVEPDHWRRPSKDLIPEIFDLSIKEPAILHVPGGYATGFRALQDNARMIVFSDVTVEESRKDDYRFDKDIWSEIWR